MNTSATQIGLSMILSTSRIQGRSRRVGFTTGLTLVVVVLGCDPAPTEVTTDPDKTRLDAASHADVLCGVDTGRPSLAPGIDHGEATDAALVVPMLDAGPRSGDSAVDGTVADADRLPDLSGNAELGLGVDPSTFCVKPQWPDPALLDERQENAFPWPLECVFPEHFRPLRDGIPLHFVTGLPGDDSKYDAIFYLGNRGIIWQLEAAGTLFSLGLRTEGQVLPAVPSGAQCVRVFNVQEGTMLRLDAMATMVPFASDNPGDPPAAQTFVFGAWSTGVGTNHEESQAFCDSLSDAPPGSIEWPSLDLAR